MDLAKLIPKRYRQKFSPAHTDAQPQGCQVGLLVIIIGSVVGWIAIYEVVRLVLRAVGGIELPSSFSVFTD